MLLIIIMSALQVMCTEGNLNYLQSPIYMIFSLTCRPLLSELNVSLLLLNMVTLPWASQNCLSLQRLGSGHEVRMRSAWPWMTRREIRSTGIMIMEMDDQDWELSQDAEITWREMHRPRDKGNRWCDHIYPTQHCLMLPCYQSQVWPQQKSKHSLTNFPPQAVFLISTRL